MFAQQLEPVTRPDPTVRPWNDGQWGRHITKVCGVAERGFYDELGEYTTAEDRLLCTINVSEMARDTGIGRVSIYRYLKTLCNFGFLVKIGDTNVYRFVTPSQWIAPEGVQPFARKIGRRSNLKQQVYQNDTIFPHSYQEDQARIDNTSSIQQRPSYVKLVPPQKEDGRMITNTIPLPFTLKPVPTSFIPLPPSEEETAIKAWWEAQWQELGLKRCPPVTDLMAIYRDMVGGPQLADFLVIHCMKAKSYVLDLMANQDVKKPTALFYWAVKASLQGRLGGTTKGIGGNKWGKTSPATIGQERSLCTDDCNRCRGRGRVWFDGNEYPNHPLKNQWSTCPGDDVFSQNTEQIIEVPF